MRLNKHTPLPWKCVGQRCPFSTPQGRPIHAFGISVNHPNGEWEAIFCNRKQDAEHIVAAVTAVPKLLEFAKEFLKRVPKCTCADYYAPYYPRTDPKCALHGYFDFVEEEVEAVKELVKQLEEDMY